MAHGTDWIQQQQQQEANGSGGDGRDDDDGDRDDPYIVFGYGSLIFRVRSTPPPPSLGWGHACTIQGKLTNE